MTQADPDNDPFCPGCGDQIADGELVSLTGHPDLCGVCADDVVARAPIKELWDTYGTPRLPHVDCPNCREKDEVGSLFDQAWCCMPACGWRGSLTAMRDAAAAKPHRVVAVQSPPRARVEYRWMSAGYVASSERQREVLDGWGQRRAEAARLSAPRSLQEQLAVPFVVLFCVLALLGVIASWGLEP